MTEDPGILMNAYTTAVKDGLLLAIGSVVFTFVCIVCVAMAIRDGVQ